MLEELSVNDPDTRYQEQSLYIIHWISLIIEAEKKIHDFISKWVTRPFYLGVVLLLLCKWSRNL